MIPIAEVVADLGADESDSDYIQRLIDQATAQLGRELNRYLGTPAPVTEYHRGRGSLILLHDDPVAVDDEPDPVVVVESRASVTDAWETVDAGDYAVDGRALRHGSRWPAGVRVTYSRGFEVGDGPEELRGVIYGMVEMAWLANNDDGIKSETLGDHSWTKYDIATAAGGAAEWQAIASRWRRQSI